MRYRLNDKVRVPEYNDTGIIVDIDEEWSCPYEVAFYSGKRYEKELFTEEELEPLFDEKENEEGRTDYIDIKFQSGAVKEKGINGCQIEDVIDVLIDKLVEFQMGDFACRENHLAIMKLEESRMWLSERTRKRIKQGVEGMNKNHD